MLKHYFLTIKSNLMKKFNSNGRSWFMSLSLFVAFMVLGAGSLAAQNWVTSAEALDILRNEVQTLETEFEQAPTDEEKVEIAGRIKYYNAIKNAIIFHGDEVPAAVENTKPQNLPAKHSSGVIAFSKTGDNFKEDVEALVSDATDLLTN